MALAGWADPERTLGAALRIIDSPLDQLIRRFSEIIDDLVPHRAAALLTGDCSQSPVQLTGDTALTTAITAAELTALAATAPVDRPWFGHAALAGTSRPVLVVATRPAGSAGSMLAVLTDADDPPDAGAAELVHRLWELAGRHIATLLPESEPVQLTASRAVAAERSRVIGELADAHAAALTLLLGALRSRGSDDATARRIATDLAVSALLEVRAFDDSDRADHEQTAGAAFSELAAKLSLLSRYSDIALELVPPDEPERLLPADVAHAARATVRGTVLAMLPGGRGEDGPVQRIRVEWRVGPTALRIVLRDNGPGTLTADALAAHHLAERLATLDGSLTVDAVPGWGTTVVAEVPLAPPAVPEADPLSALNPREFDVLGQLALGQRNRQIAAKLHISEHTVKFHVANILEKLDVRSRGEAAAAARRAGWV